VKESLEFDCTMINLIKNIDDNTKLFLLGLSSGGNQENEDKLYLVQQLLQDY
jgi:hypothetical protein